MNFLKIIPLIGASWGILFIFFLIANNRIMVKNRKAKAILILIVLFNTHYLIDSYLYQNISTDFIWSGFSYFYYHLLGYWVLLFTTLLLKLKKIPRVVTIVVIVLTVLRVSLIIYFYQEVQSLDEMVSNIGYIYLDYYLVLLVNIIPLVRLYFKLKNLNFAIQLKEKNKHEFIWIKYLVLCFIIFISTLFLYSLFALSKGREWFMQNDYEAVFITLLFFAFAFISIRIPVLPYTEILKILNNLR